MDLRAGDTVASVAVIREGRLSQVNGDEAAEAEVAEAPSEQNGSNAGVAVTDPAG
jgi:hypothetical protein